MSLSDKVAGIYKAFGEQNVPAILEHIADDVEWDYGSHSIEVPWLKRREGRAGAIEFFQNVGNLLSIERFEPKQLFEGNRVVVALLDISFTVIATGNRVDEKDEIHVFRFNDEGKIAGFRHGVDSYEHFVAFNGGTK